MMSLDDRLRAALHDLDDRAAAHVARPRTVTAPATRRARLLLPALAAAAVAAVLVGVALGFRPAATGTPVPPATQGPATPSATPSVTPSAPATPSQSAAAARRDGVYPQVAALSLGDRTARDEDAPEPVTTPEGVWQLAQPDVAPFLDTDDGCAERRAGAPAYALCSNSYTEVQLLSPDRSRLLRAYPLPELAARWIEITPAAVYCGRTGDGAVPESMLCRIDRESGELSGRLYACDVADCAPWDPDRLATWPGTWSQGTQPVSGGFDGVEPAGRDLVVTDLDGRVTVTLNPETLRER
jgi:hypothetical protein